MYLLLTLIVMTLILLVVLWYMIRPSQVLSEPFLFDVKTAKQCVMNNCYLHRLLMIEIIASQTNSQINSTREDISTPSTPSTANEPGELDSDTLTFNKITSGVRQLGRSLIRTFGSTVSQRIMSLVLRRNTIMRDYYRFLSHIKNSSALRSHLSTEPRINGDDLSLHFSETTATTLRKLESVTREIIDTIAASSQLKEIRPITHYQRLFNLLVMYDKELINQAKAYVCGQYDISMNCSQSSLEITVHIADELNVIMENSYRSTLR